MDLGRAIRRAGKRAVIKMHLDFPREFPLYAPHVQGSYRARRALTTDAIKQVFPTLCSLLGSTGTELLTPITAETFRDQLGGSTTSCAEVKAAFDRHGSDKAKLHNYQHVYGTVLADPARITSLLEIGMGTNNTDVVSNMGRKGQPGASLRAFRDYLPNALIFGADIDTRILFSEERISTFYVDQTDQAALEDLGRRIPAELDLIIDDGLHSPHANTLTLAFALNRVKIGGWIVIEDIIEAAVPFWQVVATMLPESYEPHLVLCVHGVIFAVRRCE